MPNFKPIVISFLVSMVASTSIEYMPPSWASVCSAKEASKHVDLHCNLGPNDDIRIEFDSLNYYSKKTALGISYNVNILCSRGGNLSMPWPMRVAKMANLKVEGCLIYDFMSNMSATSQPDAMDTLSTLEMIECVSFFDMLKMLNFIFSNKTVDNDWNCGHDSTLERVVYRGFTLESEEPTMEDAMDIGTMLSTSEVQFLSELETLTNGDKCHYGKLRYLEGSYENVLNSANIKFMNLDSVIPELQVLNYSNSAWNEIPVALNDWPLRYRKLEYMDFSDNYISKVSMSYLAGPTNDWDTVLDIRRNNITILGVQDIQSWSKLDKTTIDIRENPLDCSCSRSELIHAIRDGNIFVGELLKYEYIGDIVCATPDTAKGQKLKAVSDVDMGCPVPPLDLTLPLVIIAISAVILITIMALACRFRKDIKIILYVHFNILLPGDVDDKAESKKYAAFVAYSSNDGDWVHDFLQTNIETPPDSKVQAFNLCLHERDFIGGKNIMNNIIDSIENSRHTIVVLSRHFIRSIWGMEEFHQAYLESVVKKRRHLILVKLEEIPKSEMPPALQRSLNTFTYLDVNDRSFLNRLRYSLAIKPSIVPKDTSETSELQVSENHVESKESKTSKDTVNDNQVHSNGTKNTAVNHIFIDVVA